MFFLDNRSIFVSFSEITGGVESRFFEKKVVKPLSEVPKVVFVFFVPTEGPCIIF